MAFILPDLPYASDAFGDVISAETFEFHHGKHHKSYVDKTNRFASEAGLGGAKLSEVIRLGRARGDLSLFNNAAQVWNHSFFWQCLSPELKTPSVVLQRMIEREFGSIETMLGEMKQECAAHFASGWGWLVLQDGRLRITSLHDADTPVAHDGMAPLLTIDVWEHAYYLDYRNGRERYLDAVLQRAIDWDFVERNLDKFGIDRADQG